MKLSIAGLAIAMLPAALGGQALAERVAGVRQGSVRFRYASRPNVCGDGEKGIRLGDRVFAGGGRNLNIITGNIRSDSRCSRGLAEARIEVTDGRVASVRSAVPAGAGGSGRDLGVVGAREASRFFLDQLSRQTDVDDQRLLLALVIADSTSVWPDLLKLARNPSSSDARRSRALMWAGWEGDSASREPLAVFLRDGSLSRKIREGAAAGLSHMDDEGATRILLDFVRGSGEPKFRGTVVHMIGDRDDAIPAWRTMAADASVADEVRMAIFLVLSNTDDARDGQLLRTLLPSLATDKLRERLLLAVSQRHDVESGRWLAALGLSSKNSLETRKKALFWAGQSELPIRDLVAVYDRLEGGKLREHMIFVLSQREESEATDKIIAIARDGSDTDLRKKAMFWLGQRDDARSAAFLREVLK